MSTATGAMRRDAATGSYFEATEPRGPPVPCSGVAAMVGPMLAHEALPGGVRRCGAVSATKRACSD